MANEQNLRPGEHKLTKEDSSRGGKASAESRRRKKNMQETIKLLMNLGVTEKNMKVVMERLGIEENEQTNQMAIMVAMWQKAVKGSESAAVFLRDTAGEKPVDKVEQSTDLAISEKQKNAIDDVISQMKPADE